MSRTLPKPPKTVDLHADTFLDNVSEYEPEELINESILFLRENLDAAIYWGYAEIRFIHGKGKGTLRQQVYDELKAYKESRAITSFYPSYDNEDIVVVNIGL